MEEFFYEDEEGLEAAQTTFSQLIDTQQRMGEILEFMPVGLFIHRDQTIVFANKESAQMLGESQEALVGHHLFDFIETENRFELFNQFQTLFHDETAVCFEEVQIKGIDGQDHIVKVTASRLPWEGAPVAQVLLMDITELKQKENSLYLLSITDPLTGCFNRGHFVQAAGDLLKDLSEGGSELSMAVLETNSFST